MKAEKAKKKKVQTAHLLILLTSLMFAPLLSSAQTVESAREKFETGDYTGAEEELEQILAQEKENVEAQALLSEIQQTRSREKAQILTERALIEINNRNFDAAFQYLEEAILLDPENVRARELYLSIHEIVQIEEESEEEEKLIAQEQETEGAQPEILEAATPKGARLFIRVSTLYTIANSNNLDYIDSKVSLLCGRLDARYYFDILARRLGVSFDYLGSLLKASGDELIKFTIHKMNASVRFRTYLFENQHTRLLLGARLSYHLFILQNRQEFGVYNFTKIYGPSLGLFVSDPVIYRFYKKNFFKNLGFEAELNYLFLLKEGDAPKAPEFYVGSYYDLARYRFGLGYRRYTIRNSSVKENYNDIEVSAGYRF